jgi:putative nucleotidyltransferase with HDIG domain
VSKPAVSPLSAVLFAVGLTGALGLVAFPLGGRPLEIAAAVILAAIGGSALGLYTYVFQPPSLRRARRLLMLAVLVAVAAAGSKLFLSIVFSDPGRRYLPYLLPLAAAPMLVATLLETGVGLAVAAVLPPFTAFVALSLPSGRAFLDQHPLDALQMAAVFLFGSLIGLFLVHRAERWSRFLIAGAGVALVSLVSLLAFWFLSGERHATDLAWIVIGSTLSGLLSAVIAIGGPVLLGPLFGIDTRMQLMALAQLNHPLLRKLQEEAPGTFHHSVIVGNLSERAADQIGADALLVRVGCYFHDIGKTLKPTYYIENQHDGASPYDGLDPAASAKAVTDHVKGGVDLARRHRVPERVRAFIPEHHGTRLVTYFYRKAVAKDPKTDPEAFRYPGPKPQSRETAIVMMADSVEAVVRSSRDRTPERIEALVRAVIKERVAEGQFDECPLTLGDLKVIGDSFVGTLRGVYHARIDYPKPTVGEKSTIASALSAPPTLPAPMDGTAPPSVPSIESPGLDPAAAPRGS